MDLVQTIVRNKEILVQNTGTLKAKQVAKLVSDALGVQFSAYSHHLQAWQHFGVRPANGAKNPADTDPRYCYYDERHQDYGYTQAWVNMLIRKLKDPARFAEVTGRSPVAVH